MKGLCFAAAIGVSALLFSACTALPERACYFNGSVLESNPNSYLMEVTGVGSSGLNLGTLATVSFGGPGRSRSEDRRIRPGGVRRHNPGILSRPNRQRLRHISNRRHRECARCGLTAYPSATSRIIISVKPREKHSTPILECSPSDISGISSSTTT